MEKVTIMHKHCTTAMEGRIALSNSFVETAVKIQNCPIRVTCDVFPGEESVYSVDELLKPAFTSGPYNDKFSDGTYSLYMYPWKGTKVQPILEEEEQEFYVDHQPTLISEKKYKVQKKVLTPTFIEEIVTLPGYIASVLKSTREERGLTMKQVEIEVKNRYPESTFSASNLSKIEAGGANPQIMTLEYVCEVLGLHISELFPPKN